jgi:hypothetical protein
LRLPYEQNQYDNQNKRPADSPNGKSCYAVVCIGTQLDLRKLLETIDVAFVARVLVQGRLPISSCLVISLLLGGHSRQKVQLSRRLWGVASGTQERHSFRIFAIAGQFSRAGEPDVLNTLIES